MARAAHGNACGKIQESIAIYVPNFDTATMRHHKRVLAWIRRRHHFGVSGQDCARFWAGQFGSDGAPAIRILVHALTWLVNGRGVFLDRSTSPAWAICVRLWRSRSTRSSSAVGVATTSMLSAIASGQPVAWRFLSTLTFS